MVDLPRQARDKHRKNSPKEREGRVPQGEVAVARGASAVGTGAVIQGRAAQPLPLVMEAAGDAPCFFQLYTTMGNDGSMDRGYVRTVLDHAKGLGFAGVFVTVDTPNTGKEENAISAPFCTNKRSFYQDRLGTNIGKTKR